MSCREEVLQRKSRKWWWSGKSGLLCQFVRRRAGRWRIGRLGRDLIGRWLGRTAEPRRCACGTLKFHARRLETGLFGQRSSVLWHFARTSCCSGNSHPVLSGSTLADSKRSAFGCHCSWFLGKCLFVCFLFSSTAGIALFYPINC